MRWLGRKLMTAGMVGILAWGGLSGCTPKQNQTQPPTKQEKAAKKSAPARPNYQQIAARNLAAFKAAHGSYKTFNYDPQIDAISLAPTTFAGLEKESGSTLVRALVTNWRQAETMFEQQVYTAVTLHVDQVVTGQKKLRDKTLTLVLPGGFRRYGDFAQGSAYKDPAIPDDTAVFTSNELVPLPPIGTTVVVAVGRRDPAKQYAPYAAWLKKEKLTATVECTDSSGLFWRYDPQTEKLTYNTPTRQKEIDGTWPVNQPMAQLTRDVAARL
ncbi:hypothetical protein [Schleiferilactobacillus shenzhenensis]|nr:hypothetical protein [Schleiferilactobacillus shenzhenensis]